MNEESLIETPKLFSRKAIVAFSIVLTPLFGMLLYILNFNRASIKKSIMPVVIFYILWNLITFKVLNGYVANFIFSFLLPNLLGGLILTKLFWNMHFKEIQFRNRAIWGPLTVVVIVYGLLFLVNFFLSNK